MKRVLCFIVILSVNIFSCNGEENDNFEYPCSSCEYDELQSCVQDYFHKSGYCKPACHQDGVPIPRADQQVYFSKVNMTMITTKSAMTFYGINIIAFYFNKDTGNFVFAIDSQIVNMYSHYSKIILHQVGKEPFVAGDYVNGTYHLILTAVIPAPDGVLTKNSIETASITAYIPTSLSACDPPFVFGPKITHNKNPIIATCYKHSLENLNAVSAEIFLTEAPIIFLLYLQNYICDFGIVLPSITRTNTIHI